MAGLHPVEEDLWQGRCLFILEFRVEPGVVHTKDQMSNVGSLFKRIRVFSGANGGQIFALGGWELLYIVRPDSYQLVGDVGK